jgi:hypothetical protein
MLDMFRKSLTHPNRIVNKCHVNDARQTYGPGSGNTSTLLNGQAIQSTRHKTGGSSSLIDALGHGRKTGIKAGRYVFRVGIAGTLTVNQNRGI